MTQQSKYINCVCFVCGALDTCTTVTSQPLHNSAFFPFLLTQYPAFGSRPISKDGSALVCSLCKSLLNEQWRAYEQRRIPVNKRLYWMKRCDNSRTFTSEENKIKKNLIVYEAQDCSWLLQSQLDYPGDNSENDIQSTTTNNTRSKSPPINKALMQQGPRCYLCQESSTEPLNKVATEGEGECYPSLRLLSNSIYNINCNGTVMLCKQCLLHLRCQWEAFEEKKVPNSDRQYILDRGATIPPKCRSCLKTVNEPEKKGSITSNVCCDRCNIRTCELCGQILRHGAPLMPVRITAEIKKEEQTKENDRLPMLFTSLARYLPPNTDYVMACKTCFTVLELQWKEYENANTEESLRKYLLPSRKALPANRTICFICGELGKEPIKGLMNHPNKIYYVFAEKRDDKTPYFPIIKTLLPADGAKLMSSDSMVITCRFCYHNLVSQWNYYQFEKPNLSKDLRVYSLTVRCFLCENFFARAKIRTIGKGQFPFLSKLNRKPKTICLDEFDTVLVCNDCERCLVLQWLSYERTSVSQHLRKYTLDGKVLTESSHRIPLDISMSQKSDSKACVAVAPLTISASSESSKTTSSTIHDSQSQFPSSTSTLQTSDYPNTTYLFPLNMRHILSEDSHGAKLSAFAKMNTTSLPIRPEFYSHIDPALHHAASKYPAGVVNVHDIWSQSQFSTDKHNLRCSPQHSSVSDPGKMSPDQACDRNCKSTSPKFFQSNCYTSSRHSLSAPTISSPHQTISNSQKAYDNNRLDFVDTLGVTLAVDANNEIMVKRRKQMLPVVSTSSPTDIVVAKYHSSSSANLETQPTSTFLSSMDESHLPCKKRRVDGIRTNASTADQRQTLALFDVPSSSWVDISEPFQTKIDAIQDVERRQILRQQFLNLQGLHSTVKNDYDKYLRQLQSFHNSQNSLEQSRQQFIQRYKELREAIES